MEVPTTRALAAALRGARLRQGLTQNQLAERSGLSRRTIVDIETARSEPRFGALLALCDALELKLAISPRTLRDATDTSPTSRIDLDDLLQGHGK